MNFNFGAISSFIIYTDLMNYGERIINGNLGDLFELKHTAEVSLTNRSYLKTNTKFHFILFLTKPTAYFLIRE